MNAIAEDRIVN